MSSDRTSINIKTHEVCLQFFSNDDALADGVLKLAVDQSPIACCGLSPSNQLLAACSDEKKLKIWKTQTWNLVVER